MICIAVFIADVKKCLCIFVIEFFEPSSWLTGDLIFVEVKHWESAFSLVSEYDDVACLV